MHGKVLSALMLLVLVSADRSWAAPGLQAGTTEAETGSGLNSLESPLPEPWTLPAALSHPMPLGWAGPDQTDDPPGYVANQLVVRFKGGTPEDVKRSLHTRMGAQVIDQRHDGHLQLLRLYDDAVSMVFAYQARPEVVYAEPNYTASVLGAPDPGTETLHPGSGDEPGAPAAAPNDPQVPQQWYLSKINAGVAWDYSRGTNVIVAVVDTGVNCNHADLTGKCVTGYDFANNDSNPADDHGHGTHVAGIAAAATNNSLGIAAVGWDAKIMPMKALGATGNGSHFAIANAIDWAVDRGAHVVNLSLGGYFTSATLQNAVARAINQGVVVLAAAGNDGVSNPTYPAAYNGVIGVAATTQSDSRASFSNHGTFVDIAAPGVGILSTVMSGGYQSWSGTSMACPVAAGVAALLKAQDPNRTPAQIQAILEATALDLGTPGKDTLFGAGRINAGAALTYSGGPPPTSGPPPTPTFFAPQATATPASDFVRQVEDLINQERVRAGLAPVVANAALRAASGRHSGDMANGSFCSHYGSDGSSPYTRIRDAGYTWGYGEIVACGQMSPAAVVNTWMNSAPHRTIIMCPCTELGAGFSSSSTGFRTYWTVTFGTRSVTGPTPTVAAPATAGPTSTPGPTAEPPTATPPPPDVPPGGQEVVVTPAPNRIGWVVSTQPDRNYFNDDDTFTGSYGGRLYHGAMQFDLDAIPQGAYVSYARLEMIGRSRSFLGSTGTWAVRLLDTAIDSGFANHGYTAIHGALAEATLLPLLGVGDLDQGQRNTFTLSNSQVSALQSRVAQGRRISFRMDGPSGDPGMNLFTWDSGYTDESRYPGPRLVVHYSMSPATPPPPATATGDPGPTEVPPVATDGPTPTATATEPPPTPSSTAPPPPDWTPTPTDVPTIAPPPDSGLVELVPACRDVGWVRQSQPTNNLCGADTYTGYYQGFTYYGMAQFDLSPIPKGSRVVAARLELTGRDSSYLSTLGNGRWRVVLLNQTVDAGWRSHLFHSIDRATALSVLKPDMLQSHLDAGRTNAFIFDDDQRLRLEERLNGTGRVSFRFEGPRAGVSNVFSWDTGYGGVESSPPRLSLVFRAPGAGDDPEPTPDPADVERLADLIRLINTEREKAGIGPVTPSAELEKAAREHTFDMTFNDFFSHTGSDRSTPSDRVARSGFRAVAVGEMLAAATADPGLIVSTWMSREQRQVLLDPRFTHVGAAYMFRTRTAYRHYWTVKLAEAAP